MVFLCLFLSNCTEFILFIVNLSLEFVIDFSLFSAENSASIGCFWILPTVSLTEIMVVFATRAILLNFLLVRFLVDSFHFSPRKI